MKKIYILLIISAITSGCSIISIPPDTTSRPLPSVETPAKTNDSATSKDTLNLSGQGLNQLTQDIFKNTGIKKLDVSNNNLTGAIPAEIRHLQNLEELNASNNNMTGVPAEIGQLKKLRVLNLSNNQLTGLPYELGNLSSLKVLNLSGNNYSKQDLSIIIQTLPADVTIIK